MLLADPRFLTSLRDRYGFAGSQNTDAWLGAMQGDPAAHAAISGLGAGWMFQYTTPAVTLGWRGTEFDDPR